MGFFIGEYKGKIDSKGRLVLPSRFKSQLPEEEDQLVLRIGFEKNLVLYTWKEYEPLQNKINALSEFDPQHRALRRYFFRGTTTLSLDSLGRLLIPRNFLSYAELSAEAVIIGVGYTIEIWSPKYSTEVLQRDSEDYSQLAKRILDA